MLSFNLSFVYCLNGAFTTCYWDFGSAKNKFSRIDPILINKSTCPKIQARSMAQGSFERKKTTNTSFTSFFGAKFISREHSFGCVTIMFGILAFEGLTGPQRPPGGIFWVQSLLPAFILNEQRLHHLTSWALLPVSTNNNSTIKGTTEVIKSHAILRIATDSVHRL